MGELGRNDGPADRNPEGDRPEQRPDRRLPKPDPPKSADAYYNVDRKKLTPVQRAYVRDHADNPPEAPPGGLPYTIDWKTGESLDDRKWTPEADRDRTPDDGEERTPADAQSRTPVDELPDDVRGVHDPVDETRPRDKPGGLAYVDQRDQWTLENAVPKDADGNPEKFPDPEGEWTEYVNDGGSEIDHFRGNNCLDCSVAAIATWHGHPTVSAPRFPDRRSDGTLDRIGGEIAGPDRAEEWLGARYENLGVSDDGLAEIEQKLREGGHGSCAAIINAWSPEFGGGAHAWNAFNHNGKITWYDPQKAVTSDQPVYSGRRVGVVAAICLDSEGKQL